MAMTALLRRLRSCFEALDERLSRVRLAVGAVFGALLCAGFALMSVYAGPLYNLNDIGGFKNRVVFIALAAAAYGVLLLLTAALSRGSVYRMLLRQLVMTAGWLILLTGINQKTYFYVETMQPLVRAMDGAGLSALAGWETGLSAPAATLLYLVTRGPVYDMYPVKLLCVFCFLLLVLMTVYLADKREMGLRAEALMTLCVILPQGFMSAGCAPLLDTVCLALLAASLLLALGGEGTRMRLRAAAVLFGLAAAVSGLALYALPVFVYLAWTRRMTARELAASLSIPALLCLPAVMAGVPAGEALLSLLRANFALPQYAAGAPGVMSLIPRAQVSEMPIIAWMRHLPEIDEITNAQPYYTQAHFEIAARGFAVAGVAIYSGLAAWLYGKKDMSVCARVFTLALGALIVCPGATNAAWLAASLAGLYVIFDRRELRLPACMVLFAASASAVYPMTEMTYLPPAAAFVLCLCALLMAVGILPTALNKEESGD